MSVPAAADARDPVGLATALGSLGVPCVVEPRAGLAVIRATDGGAMRLASASMRRDVLALGRQHGFTHVAVELDVGLADPGAPVLRD
jgi:hypothetical protein